MDPTLEQASLMINAWTGPEGAPTGHFGSDWRRWATRRQFAAEKKFFLESEEPVDLRLWQDPRVGWGIILPENTAITPAERASGADAPEPIRQLIAERKGPVFRYLPSLGTDKLERYYWDGTQQTIAISGSMRGTGRGRIPGYLLIYAPPSQVPWDLQYALNVACFVGRLDLTGPALENYVKALRSGWKDAMCRRDRPVVWATDHGGGDITTAMHQLIDGPIAKALTDDSEVKKGKLVYLEGAGATRDALAQALVDQTPALVVTTSHGKTGPLAVKEEMARDLGLLVDATKEVLAPDALLAKWDPYGAIWYAHACCSAGCDSKTAYKGLVEPGSSIGGHPRGDPPGSGRRSPRCRPGCWARQDRCGPSSATSSRRSTGRSSSPTPNSRSLTGCARPSTSGCTERTPNPSRWPSPSGTVTWAACTSSGARPATESTRARPTPGATRCDAAQAHRS